MFEEIWERIKDETDISTFREMAEKVGTRYQYVSDKKRKNEFPLKWVFQIAQEYGLSTDWIMTGNGARKIEKKEAIAKSNDKYIRGIESWLEEITKKDSRNRIWFERHFEISFPQFEAWWAEKETEEKKGDFLSGRVRESVD